MSATIANPELLDKWAKAVGITNKHITRIVVDMTLNDVVKVYVEQLGDEQMIAVDPPEVNMVAWSSDGRRHARLEVDAP